jgi:hypothetical protein
MRCLLAAEDLRLRVQALQGQLRRLRPARAPLVKCVGNVPKDIFREKWDALIFKVSSPSRASALSGLLSLNAAAGV